MLGLFLTFCSRQETVLERVREAGELRFITRNAPTTYYQGVDGPTGLEHDLVSRFARTLGVSARPVVVPSNYAAISALERGEGELVASSLAVTPRLKRRVHFGPIYQRTTQQVVYRGGSRRPRSAADLVGRDLEVAADSPAVARLADLARTYPGLSWRENREAGTEGILALVWQQLVDCTVANSNEVVLTRRYYPELRVGFDLGPELSLAWAFPRDSDDSLYLAAIYFFNRLHKSGELARIMERHYGHVTSFDYVGIRKMLRHIRERLPRYRAFFEEAARRNGFDWRLLAAIGYQESHWRPAAVSPTGVRGIMMLTQATARQMGVKDRKDPEQSIAGGARYLRRVKARIPSHIPEPDRTWFALAAYNLGYGHVQDARRLARKAGRNPDRWLDVRSYLELLGQESWYRKTRYGYAQGAGAVRYVENVRRYVDMLVWVDNQLRAPRPERLRALGLEAPAL